MFSSTTANTITRYSYHYSITAQIKKKNIIERPWATLQVTKDKEKYIDTKYRTCITCKYFMSIKYLPVESHNRCFFKLINDTTQKLLRSKCTTTFLKRWRVSKQMKPTWPDTIARTPSLRVISSSTVYSAHHYRLISTSLHEISLWCELQNFSLKATYYDWRHTLVFI